MKCQLLVNSPQTETIYQSSICLIVTDSATEILKGITGQNVGYRLLPQKGAKVTEVML